MKKTYLAKHNALFLSGGMSWGLLALLFALAAFAARFLIPNAFTAALAPELRFANSLAAAGDASLASFADASALQARVEDLMAQNAVLSNENRALQEKEAELESVLGADPAHAQPGIGAGVIARPPVSPYGALIVAGGSSNGIASGMEAFGPGGVPLGVVSSATDDFSRVTLFSAPGVRTEGWAGSAKAPVTLFGVGAGAFSAEVSRASGIAVGDLVYVPGPGALPIGSITRIDGDPSSPTEVLRIAPALNPFSITWVVLRASSPALLSALSAASSTLP